MQGPSTEQWIPVLVQTKLNFFKYETRGSKRVTIQILREFLMERQGKVHMPSFSL